MKKKRQWFMCLGMIGVFTASVILSVFGQRKVKAQLNTENAGKITSSWADEKHIFSSFDDEKALSVLHPTVLRCMQQIRRRRS